MIFVFPIPGTIALRNLLLISGFCLLLWKGRQQYPQALSNLKMAGLGMVALSGWIAFHSVTIANVPSIALDQFRANWLNPILVGFIAAWAARQIQPRQATQGIVAGLAIHMLWLLGYQFHMWLTSGSWPFKATPFAAYDYHGTINSFFLALVIADRCVWWLEAKSPLGLGKLTGWILVFLGLAADIVLQSRNSSLVDIFIVLSATIAIWSLRGGSWRTHTLIGLIVLLAGTTLMFDKRWSGLIHSAEVGWTSTSNYWRTADPKVRPTVPEGTSLEESAYFRVAWARQAIGMVSEKPLGTGFAHDAFGRTVAETYGLKGMGSSHSGWLDLTIGIGIPGLLLLLLSAGLTMLGGWRLFRHQNEPMGLVLSFLVSSYLFRCLLDGHLSGWRLGLFAFICGALIGVMRETDRKA